MNHSAKILESWEANAQNWIHMIDNGEIESRITATNDAIVNCIVSYLPKKVLDIGCGEGWLTRALRNKGVAAFGVDGIQSVVDDAVRKDGPHYFHFTYEEMVHGRSFLPSPFDAVAINFALIDKENTESLLNYIPNLLRQDGHLFIQTLHPLIIASGNAYSSGWKEGSWTGMKQNFVQPYLWYFRTMEDWLRLFKESGFSVEETREPVHPDTRKPLSVIFVLKQCNH